MHAMAGHAGHENGVRWLGSWQLFQDSVSQWGRKGFGWDGELEREF